MWLVNFIYWVQAFLGPFLVAGIIDFLVTKDILAVALVTGGELGVIVAEYIRR